VTCCAQGLQQHGSKKLRMTKLDFSPSAGHACARTQAAWASSITVTALPPTTARSSRKPCCAAPQHQAARAGKSSCAQQGRRAAYLPAHPCRRPGPPSATHAHLAAQRQCTPPAVHQLGHGPERPQQQQQRRCWQPGHPAGQGQRQGAHPLREATA